MKGSYAPPSVSHLQLQTASLVPSIGTREAPEIFLLLKDPKTEEVCSTRFQVKDAATAIGMARALAPCRHKTLAELGELEIPEDNGKFPGLREVL